jgi:DNA-binding NarL/FixJ family response regulator
MRIFIAEADQELLMALQMLLHQEPGMAVVGLAVHSRGLFAQVAASQPDVVLLDWQLPDRPAASILADLHALDHRPRIIVLHVRPELEREARAAGADSFVTKTASSDQLVAILRQIRDGSFVPRQREVEKEEEVRDTHRDAAVGTFSNRQ